MKKISLEFTEIDYSNIQSMHYTDTCSGNRSDCCTRTCTRRDNLSDSDLKEWENYLELVSGVIQY
ncbi:hypothetical protein [Campylobacter sp.]|uniref:hypothetical protein n=1 Tax=Campylobacter sp. TaxID=205 RepID=UPI0025BAC685|nr:hypothetical protein [Campylobacter sp.]